MGACLGRAQVHINEDEILMQVVEDKFKEFDKDGSGSIDVSELRELISHCLGGTEFSNEDLRDALREMDKDDGGSVSLEEFKKWFFSEGGDRKAKTKSGTVIPIVKNQKDTSKAPVQEVSVDKKDSMTEMAETTGKEGADPDPAEVDQTPAVEQA